MGLSKRCWPIAESINITGVEDLPERVEMLREFGICPVLINFGMDWRILSCNRRDVWPTYRISQWHKKL